MRDQCVGGDGCGWLGLGMKDVKGVEDVEFCLLGVLDFNVVVPLTRAVRGFYDSGNQLKQEYSSEVEKP